MARLKKKSIESSGPSSYLYLTDSCVHGNYVCTYAYYTGTMYMYYVHFMLLMFTSRLFVQLKGGGPARLVQLQPRCTFAMDMAQLVSFNPEGLLISKVVPIYKTTFGRELVVTNLGYSKLIKALESLPNILVVSD